MPYPSHEPVVSSRAINLDLKDIDVLCTFKINIESQNTDHGCIKDQWPYSNQEKDAKPPVSYRAPSQKPPASSKAQIRTYRTWWFFAPPISRWEPKLEHGCIKDQLLYPNEDQHYVEVRCKRWPPPKLANTKYLYKQRSQII